MKKESIPEPFFKQLVEVYFSFCEKKFKCRPSFDGSSPRDFKNIIIALRKKNEASNLDWTLDISEKSLLEFLEECFLDNWIRNNFLLRNLNNQKDKIFFKLSSNNNSIQNNFYEKNRRFAASEIGKPGATIYEPL